MSPQAVTVDSIASVLRAKGQVTCFTVSSLAVISIILGGTDIILLYR